jgi:hypothetical protein
MAVIGAIIGTVAINTPPPAAEHPPPNFSEKFGFWIRCGDGMFEKKSGDIESALSPLTVPRPCTN